MVSSPLSPCPAEPLSEPSQPAFEREIEFFLKTEETPRGAQGHIAQFPLVARLQCGGIYGLPHVLHLCPSSPTVMRSHTLAVDEIEAPAVDEHQPALVFIAAQHVVALWVTDASC